jgi:hypothetical protein
LVDKLVFFLHCSITEIISVLLIFSNFFKIIFEFASKCLVDLLGKLVLCADLFFLHLYSLELLAKFINPFLVGQVLSFKSIVVNVKLIDFLILSSLLLGKTFFKQNFFGDCRHQLNIFIIEFVFRLSHLSSSLLKLLGKVRNFSLVESILPLKVLNLLVEC